MYLENLKKTPLYECHLNLNGEMVDFAGWNLPLQYKGIIQEHEKVRNDAGIFDVSHMGEITVKGQDAFNYFQYIVTNDISKLQNNDVIYTFMCNPHGGVVDDLLVYKFEEDYFMLVVNAGNIDKDFQWLISNKEHFYVNICNISAGIAQVAVQGPKAQDVLQKIAGFDLNELKFFKFKRGAYIDGNKCMISRTGYTGEDGFEIYSDNESIISVWKSTVEAGKEYGILPAGLGARDTLRFEANLPLYGNELSEDISPIEAGYGFFVKTNKGDFVGKDALLRQKKDGVKRKIVGFKMTGRGIPRKGYEVKKNNKNIGFVTTGYFSPTLKKSIGLAMIDIDYTDLNTEIDVMIRNKPIKAAVISRKFYTKNYREE